MKTFFAFAVALPLVLVLAAPSFAWCRASAVVRVKAVAQVQIKQVVQQVQVKQVIQQVNVVEKVRVAAVVTPLVQYSSYAYAAPHASYYVPPPDDSRLRALERSVVETNQNVQRLAEIQSQMLQRLPLPPAREIK